MILKCQCCGIEQEFADGEAAFRAGWDAPPHFRHYVACNLCPGVCLIVGLSHEKAHALWAREGRPADFILTKCAPDRDWDSAVVMTDGACPDCGCRQFIHGPRGGIARNFGCIMCGAWYNVAIWKDVVSFAQRIEPGTRPGEETWPRGPLPLKT